MVRRPSSRAWPGFGTPHGVPELHRLARTIDSWRSELLAYFDTGGVSNGPTEAINLLIKKIKRVSVPALGSGTRRGGVRSPGGTSSALTLVPVACEEPPMQLRVERTEEGHRLAGDGVDVELVNRFLAHCRCGTSRWRPAGRMRSTC